MRFSVGFAAAILSLAVTPVRADITPALTEINLGPVPIDKYDGLNSGADVIPSCPETWNVKVCIKWMFNNDPSKVLPGEPQVNPNNYRRQGVTGVRFFFGLGGGAGSQAFQTYSGVGPGAVSDAWALKLGAFLFDLKSYGIDRVSPTPATTELWSVGGPNASGFLVDRPDMTSLNNGESGKVRTLKFLKWLPYGLIKQEQKCTEAEKMSDLGCNDLDGIADGFEHPEGWAYAAANPVFWGWQPFFDLILRVHSEVSGAGLVIADFDLANERSFNVIPAEARLVYDNTTNTDVLKEIRDRLTEAEGSRVTFSARIGRPWQPREASDPRTTDYFSCPSQYGYIPDVREGDSALLFDTSSLAALYAGERFGVPPHLLPDRDGNVFRGLACLDEAAFRACGEDDECKYGHMPRLPVPHSQPSVINMHSHVCGSPYGSYDCDPRIDSTNSAKSLYDAVYRFLERYGRLNDYVVFGETNAHQLGRYDPDLGYYHCEGSTQANAVWNVNGFKQSDLYLRRLGTPNQSRTAMRPWNYIVEGTRKARFVRPAVQGVRLLEPSQTNVHFEWATGTYRAPHDLGPYAFPFGTGLSSEWVSEYRLNVGSQQGASDIHVGQYGLQTYAKLPILPGDGRQVFARISTLVDGAWQYTDGQYLAPAGNQVPMPLLVTPSSGSGASQVFNFVYTDANGFADLSYLTAQVNQVTYPISNACLVFYDRLFNQMWLYNEGGYYLGPFTPTASGTGENGQCILNAAESSVVGIGSNLELRLAFAFKSSFAGQKNLYATAQDEHATGGAWYTLGSWTVAGPYNGAPVAVAENPSTGSGASQTFRFQYSDPNGSLDLSRTESLINSALTGQSGCYIRYDRFGNALYLADNGGLWPASGAPPGLPGYLQNSQCAVNTGQSSVSTAGNDTTVAVTVSFKTPFAGAKNVYMWARDQWGLETGWQPRGTWVVPSNIPTAPIPIFSTGVVSAGQLAADGAADAHYTLPSSPDPAFPGPIARVVNSNVWPIPPWISNGPNSKWIGPRADAGNTNQPGVYFYRTLFDLTGMDPASAVLSGQIAADDSVYIRLNGNTVLPAVAGFSSYTPFSIQSGFTPGLNTLEFVVANPPLPPPNVPSNPTGLRVEISGIAVSTAPRFPIVIYGTGVVSAGQLAADGASDPHYSLTSSADPAFPGPIARVLIPSASPFPPYLANGPNSKWIGPRSDGNNLNQPGTYVYRTTFDLTGYNPATAVLSGFVGVDDDMVVRLNGATVSSTIAGFESFTPLSIQSGFIPGLNTLEFVVTNRPFLPPKPPPNPTALRVEVGGTVSH